MRVWGPLPALNLHRRDPIRRHRQHADDFVVTDAGECLDPFRDGFTLSLQDAVTADWSQFPDNNVWGAVFLDGTLYVQVLASKQDGIGWYDFATDTLQKLYDTSDSFGLATDGEHLVVGSESGCVGAVACLRRYTVTGAHVDEQPMLGIFGGLRGVASRGTVAFMLAAVEAPCSESIGVVGLDYSASAPASALHSCAGRTTDRALMATRSSTRPPTRSSWSAA